MARGGEEEESGRSWKANFELIRGELTMIKWEAEESKVVPFDATIFFIYPRSRALAFFHVSSLNLDTDI